MTHNIIPDPDHIVISDINYESNLEFSIHIPCLSSKVSKKVREKLLMKYTSIIDYQYKNNSKFSHVIIVYNAGVNNYKSIGLDIAKTAANIREEYSICEEYNKNIANSIEFKVNNPESVARSSDSDLRYIH